MPGLPPTSWPVDLPAQGLGLEAVPDLIHRASDVNGSANPVNVLCAWPVSGQYGPGSRLLYYVLIVACVLARKAEWLKRPCLAAALLVPAVAAVHGIVLAAVHVPGAADLDVYGSFQLCSIGITAAPITVTLSRTYFEIRGRNTIFIWAGLILAGLLSLTIEFYRIDTHKCFFDNHGVPLPSNPHDFPYGSAFCNLTCSISQGPFSPLRQGSTNNIYVIPAPSLLNFGLATLLGAACSIHAILWLASMLDKILLAHGKRLYSRTRDLHPDETIPGTNAATEGHMRGVNGMIKFFLSIAVIPVFVAAGLALLIIGEINLFSPQMLYQTEPISSIGQWAPIVGTVLAVLGSLYILLAADVEAVKTQTNPEGRLNASASFDRQRGSNEMLERIPTLNLQTVESGSTVSRSLRSDSDSESCPNPVLRTSTTQTGLGIIRTSSNAMGHNAPDEDVSRTGDAGGRRKVAKAIFAIGEQLGAATRDWFDETDFRRGRAVDFPEIPGEELRNSQLNRIREQYNPPRDAEGTPIPQSPRASSVAGSVRSNLTSDIAGPSSPPERPPLHASQTATRHRSSTTPSQSSYGLRRLASLPASSPRPHRTNTLEVPSPTYLGAARDSPRTTAGFSRQSDEMQSTAGDEYMAMDCHDASSSMSRQSSPSPSTSRAGRFEG